MQFYVLCEILNDSLTFETNLIDNKGVMAYTNPGCKLSLIYHIHR